MFRRRVSTFKKFTFVLALFVIFSITGCGGSGGGGTLTSQSPVGTWVSEDVSFNDDPFVIHFFENNYYETSGSCDFDGTTGMEYGIYTTIDALISRVSSQGQCSPEMGFDNGNTATINGDVMAIKVNGSDIIYNRLQGTNNPIVGSWLHGNIQDAGENHMILTFLNDFEFMLSQDCTNDDLSGFEFGNYFWDQGFINELAVDSINIDSNGSCGLNDATLPGNFENITATVSGNTLTLTIPGEPADIIFTRHTDTAALTCGYESGWDNVALEYGAPIIPNNFADYETVLSDCNTMPITAEDIAGTSYDDAFVDLSVFNPLASSGGTGNGTVAVPGTGSYIDRTDVYNFEWWVETVNSRDYLVVYYDSSIEPALPANFWFRETSALKDITGTPGIAGSSYNFVKYAEQSNYSDADRATGDDGEIFNTMEALQ